jgi:hypothetical protein
MKTKRVYNTSLYIDYQNLEDLKSSRFYTIMIIQIYYTSAFFFLYEILNN